VQALFLTLKSLTGMSPVEPLRLRESLETDRGFVQPSTVDAAVTIALRTRPDLQMAILNQEVAAAGLRLVKAQARPGLSAFAQFSIVRSDLELASNNTLPQRDRLLTFGVNVGLPVFNRNQGAKAEASVAIRQAQQRREYLDQVIRYEVAGAYARFSATDEAILTIQQGVISRAMQNVNTMRAAYQLGQFTITELLAEQRRLLDVERDYTEALAERYRAMVQIQIALGASNLR
jgi:cobalt-zinc-cadmium efflux system outer membrane protein